MCETEDAYLASFFIHMDVNKIDKNHGPTYNRQGEYARIAKLAPRAIERLAELLEHRAPNIALGAANTILKKVIPDLKAVELGGAVDTDGKRQPIQIFINRGAGFVPIAGQLSSPSDSGDERSAPVQSISVAQASEEDDDSDNGNHNPESA